MQVSLSFASVFSLDTRKTSPWVRRSLGLFCLGSRWLDGPHVLHPRIFVLADAVISFSLGPLFGIVDAVTRMLLGTVWGLLKISFLYEAVIPLSVASFDRPYMAYGAMLRVALIEKTDTETVGLPHKVRGGRWCYFSFFETTFIILFFSY